MVGDKNKSNQKKQYSLLIKRQIVSNTSREAVFVETENPTSKYVVGGKIIIPYGNSSLQQLGFLDRGSVARFKVL